MKTNTRLIQPSALQILPTPAQSLRRSAESAKPFDEVLDERLKPETDPALPAETQQQSTDDDAVDQGGDTTDTEHGSEPVKNGDASAGGVQDEPSDAAPPADTDDAESHADREVQEQKLVSGSLPDSEAAIARPDQQASEPSYAEGASAKEPTKAERPKRLPDSQSPQTQQTDRTKPLPGTKKVGSLHAQNPKGINPSAGDRVAAQEQSTEASKPDISQIASERLGEEAPRSQVSARKAVDPDDGAFRERLRQQALGAAKDEQESKPVRGDAPKDTDPRQQNHAPKHVRAAEPAQLNGQPATQSTSPATAVNPAAFAAAPLIPDAIRSVLERIQGVRAMMPGGSTAQASGAQPNPGSVTAVGSTGGASIGADGGGAAKLGVLRGQANSVDRGAVIAQVQRGLASVMRSGGGEMTIRLRPDHLGELKIRVHAEDGAVRAVFETKTQGAREAIEHGLVKLREQLESRGVRVEDLRVDHREQPTSDLGGDPAHDESHNPQDQGSRRSRHAPRSTGDAHSEPGTPIEEPRGIWTELGLDAVA